MIRGFSMHPIDDHKLVVAIFLGMAATIAAAGEPPPIAATASGGQNAARRAIPVLSRYAPSTAEPDPSRPLIQTPVVSRVYDVASPDTVLHSDDQTDCACDPCCRRRNLRNSKLGVWFRETHLGHAFMRHPAGDSVAYHTQQHINNGLAAQLVLYQFDFFEADFGDPAVLTPTGRRRLAKFTNLLLMGTVPLVIEESADPDVDAARKRHVLAQLETLTQIEFPEERIVIGYPTARGLAGDEAQVIYDNLYEQTRAGGVGSSGASDRTSRTATVIQTGGSTPPATGQ
jgi:hypothetical protein